MKLVNYENLKKKIVNAKIPKPSSGTLSGHAAGEPFDKHVYHEIKKEYPNDTFRQYEYLNYLFSENLDTKGSEARNSLFNSPSVEFLLKRGKDATKKWSIKNQFEEKQNDTADILVTKDDFFEIIDIKTRNLSKKAQAPNIISAYKLAQMCEIMIDNNEFNTFTINYIEIDWLLEGKELVCKDAYYINLFKVNPKDLYINWSAGKQIQFHVSDIKQNFTKNKEEWAKEYLKHYASKSKDGMQKMIKKFVKPFEKYI